VVNIYSSSFLLRPSLGANKSASVGACLDLKSSSRLRPGSPVLRRSSLDVASRAAVYPSKIISGCVLPMPMRVHAAPQLRDPALLALLPTLPRALACRALSFHGRTDKKRTAVYVHHCLIYVVFLLFIVLTCPPTTYLLTCIRVPSSVPIYRTVRAF